MPDPGRRHYKNQSDRGAAVGSPPVTPIERAVWARERRDDAVQRAHGSPLDVSLALAARARSAEYDELLARHGLVDADVAAFGRAQTRSVESTGRWIARWRRPL